MKNFFSHKKQLGLTLIEGIATLGVLSAVLALAATLTDNYLKDTKALATAQHVRMVGEGSRSYVKDNFAALQAIATATQPAVIPVSALTNYLSPGFNSVNGYGQTTCILVLKPAANTLNALVVTTGGTTIDDLTLGQIAGSIGASGGAIYSASSTTVTGAQGSYAFAVGNFASAVNSCATGGVGTTPLAGGHPVMALWFENTDTATGFLYRSAVPGRPELNQMQTTLDMGGNQITGLLSTTSGSACTTTGNLARGASGEVLSCQSATWQSSSSAYWKEPVANLASLPTCNAGTIWQTRIVQTPTTGTGPHAHTCDGVSWKALSVDDSGNITVAGTATINKLAGNLTIMTTATDGNACSPDGSIAKSTLTSGLILSCQTQLGSVQ